MEQCACWGRSFGIVTTTDWGENTTQHIRAAREAGKTHWGNGPASSGANSCRSPPCQSSFSSPWQHRGLALPFLWESGSSEGGGVRPRRRRRYTSVPLRGGGAGGRKVPEGLWSCCRCSGSAAQHCAARDMAAAREEVSGLPSSPLPSLSLPPPTRAWREGRCGEFSAGPLHEASVGLWTRRSCFGHKTFTAFRCVLVDRSLNVEVGMVGKWRCS